MSQTRVLVLLAGAAISATAWAGETPDQDRAYAAELKADALARTSASTDSALTAADGESKVVLGGFMQFRYYLNFRDDPGDTGVPHDSGFTNGFETTRTRLQATGNVISKDFTYKVEGQFDKDGGAFTLLDAYARWGFDNGVGVIFGQWQNPLFREWSLSPKGELGADYSVVTEVFNPGYEQGVGVDWKSDAWHVQVSANDGLRSGNTVYTSGAEADYGLTARAEFKGGGDWKLFDDFSGWRGQETAWLVGAGLNYQHNGNTASTTGGPQVNLWLAALDAQIEGNGWNIYGAGIWSRFDPDGPAASFDDWGLILQGGIFVADNVELFAGWNAIFTDSDHGAGLDGDFHTFMGGLNYYPFAKTRAVRFTGEIEWFSNKVDESFNAASISASNNVGLRPDANDNQIAIIFQAEVTF